PDTTPAITFTSDPSALGNGIFTFALLPNQGVESIVKHAAANNDSRVLILAPDTKTGWMLANSALESSALHGVRVVGMYYYREGDMGSMKEVAERGSMFVPRESANVRAKEILSDILLTRQLSPNERLSVNKQLEALNKSDTVGRLPYDAVLFLGNANDSKALASFLRYFDVPTNTVRFYGTAMWDANSMFSDMTMAGAQFASLPQISQDFARVYTDVRGIAPNRMSSMGYDAAMLSINALMSGESLPGYLMNRSGFAGIDGLVRLKPNGTNERALQIMRLDGSGAPRLEVAAARNFMRPLYQTTTVDNRKSSEIGITYGINPMDYINLPLSVSGAYSSKTFTLAPRSTAGQAPVMQSPLIVLPEDDSDIIMISDPDYSPYQIDAVDRRYIEEVTLTTR
ncbi:MAG: penicillin-binding protein activator, partial [Alphaproteobacteria bacterium]|nr:penicillin-binding protein activator [Alphaproteobacteria bacterium]